MIARAHWTICGAVLAVAASCLSTAIPAQAQSKKTAKQAESLESAGDKAKSAVQDVLEHLAKLLTGYNSIIDGEAGNTKSAYNKLVGDLKAMEKKIDTAKKQLTGLTKEADRFFAAWEDDLSSITSDSVREKSAKRLDSARKRYASIGETLVEAREEFAPLVQDLNDQILYLGRDLSPEAVADLQDEAEALNQRAAEVTTKVKAMLQSAGRAQDEAEAAIEEGDSE